MSTKRFEDEESVLDFGFVPLESEKNCTRRTWRGAIRSSLKSASIHTAFAAQQNGECMQPSPGTAAAFSRGTSYGLNGLAESSQPREREAGSCRRRRPPSNRSNERPLPLKQALQQNEKNRRKVWAHATRRRRRRWRRRRLTSPLPPGSTPPATTVPPTSPCAPWWSSPFSGTNPSSLPPSLPSTSRRSQSTWGHWEDHTNFASFLSGLQLHIKYI